MKEIFAYIIYFLIFPVWGLMVTVKLWKINRPKAVSYLVAWTVLVLSIALFIATQAATWATYVFVIACIF